MISDVRCGENEDLAWDSDNALVQPATGAWWQFSFARNSDVYANLGKIAVGRFPNVGAAVKGDGARAGGVRVGADSEDTLAPSNSGHCQIFS